MQYIMNDSDFHNKLHEIRKRLLTMHYKAKAGHIGGNLSCLEAMFMLHHKIMSKEDRFVLSKGHSAGMLYCILWSIGKLSDAELDTFCADGSRLAGHPSVATNIEGILFSTGSLGHGPSLASGLALASRLKNTSNKVYCLCSDGEWQEGSCWEALIFAVHNKLDNLVILIDQNKLQGFGTTEEVVSFSDLSSRIQSFGAFVSVIDGHNPTEIYNALMQQHKDKPHFVILNTIKGRGLKSENMLSSHYLPISDAEYNQLVV